MNDIVARAIKALRSSQTMHAGPKEVESIIGEMEALDLDAEKVRADAAEAKVCELVEAAGKAKTELAHCVHIMGRKGGLYEEALEGLKAALDSTADIRAKWCPVSEVIGAFTKAGLALGIHSTMGLDAHIERIVDDSAAALRERDEALAKADTAIKAHSDANDVMHAALRDLETARNEANQCQNAYEGRHTEADEATARAIAAEQKLIAAQAEIARLRPLVATARIAVKGLSHSLAALDAVPGDDSARPEAKRDPVLSTVRAATSPLDW